MVTLVAGSIVDSRTSPLRVRFGITSVTSNLRRPVHNPNYYLLMPGANQP